MAGRKVTRREYAQSRKSKDGIPHQKGAYVLNCEQLEQSEPGIARRVAAVVASRARVATAKIGQIGVHVSRVQTDHQREKDADKTDCEDNTQKNVHGHAYLLPIRHA